MRRDKVDFFKKRRLLGNRNGNGNGDGIVSCSLAAHALRSMLDTAESQSAASSALFMFASLKSREPFDVNGRVCFGKCGVERQKQTKEY